MDGPDATFAANCPSGCGFHQCPGAVTVGLRNRLRADAGPGARTASGTGRRIDQRNNPLTAIAAKDGYKPKVKQVRVVSGETVRADFALQKAGCQA
jgi:hypothetical protein